MNSDIIQGNWKEVKGKIKQQWGKFTDDDIAKMKGTYDELAGKIQATYGHQKEKSREEIDAFIKTHNWKAN